MSRDDCEKGGRLLNPFIEIGKGYDPHTLFYVNVTTFGECMEHLIPTFTDHGPMMLDKKFYSIYGTVGRSVVSPSGGSYVNIAEPPISRTLMGFVLEMDLKNHLPNVHRALI
ncbi:MAG TPA: hypothetical protein VMC80_03605 [Patescibacteria group bacterium]|nr:hypothetical protein [Patescibacteria group bacterium]